ncbi:MAG: SseB family protein [Clostridiales bacterium]|nr:SseB family protein [Clostridiales bacterium]
MTEPERYERHDIGQEPDSYANNKYIRMAVERIYETDSVSDRKKLLAVLLRIMEEEGEAPMPMVDVNGVLDGITIEDIEVGKTIQFDRDLRLRMATVTDNCGNEWFPLFTSEEECQKKYVSNIIINVPVEVILNNGRTSDRVTGVVIDPYGVSMKIPKDILGLLFKVYGK